MRVSITYIHHNCFVMAQGDLTFLFDYPGDSHLPEGADDLVRQAVSEKELVVFISHGHDDHLNGDLASVTSGAASVRYVMSDDVEDMRPEAVPNNGEVLIVEPDESYEFHGMAIDTLMANDLGVAFLVNCGNFRFYFGGDLAKWIWESASPQEAAFTESYFRESMKRVRDFSPHVAFSNVDKRLPNLAGGDEACRIIAPPLFVPMHTFGDTATLAGFPELVREVDSEIFLYESPGDSESFPV